MQTVMKFSEMCVSYDKNGKLLTMSFFKNPLNLNSTNGKFIKFVRYFFLIF